MPQLHCYIPQELATRVQQRAEAEGMTVSGYLASLIKREVGADWPEGYFEKVAGSWEGEPLQRPPQGQFEERDRLHIAAE